MTKEERIYKIKEDLKLLPTSYKFLNHWIEYLNRSIDICEASDHWTEIDSVELKCLLKIAVELKMFKDNKKVVKLNNSCNHKDFTIKFKYDNDKLLIVCSECEEVRGSIPVSKYQ